MDEMALIEDLCAAVPAPDPARLAALRARLLDEAGRGPAPATASRSRVRGPATA